MANLIEKINKLNLIDKFSLDNKKIILIILMSVTILYFDFNFLLKAQMASAAKSKEEVVKVNNDLKALDAGLKNMQAVKAGQKAAAKLPDKRVIFEPELTSLLHDISKLANANNVRILQIKPARETKKDAIVKFTPVLISMDLICGYHNLGRFMNALENNQVFMSIESYKIESQAQDSLRQKVSLAVRTYARK